MASGTEDIDDSLYSRQRYVLGDEAMIQMAQSDVFLSGLGGLGVEIAKNIVLAGVKCLTVHDTKAATLKDLGTQFYLREDDVRVKRNRAEASVQRLSELNPYVKVRSSTQELKDSELTFLSQFKCVIITEALELCRLTKMNQYCRSQNPPIKFIMAGVYGLQGFVFCDFGDEFTINDYNGVEPKTFFIAGIKKDNPGIVSGFDLKPHGFRPNDHITFKDVKGMTALNGTERQVKVKSPLTFSIGDLTGEEFSPYESGGVAIQVKKARIAKYKSLAAQLPNPSIKEVDFTKDPASSHLGIWALLRFREDHNRLPAVRSEEDAETLITIAITLNKKMTVPVEPLNINVIRTLAYTAEGSFTPLTASIGGIVAQESLKALTGKFTPINQWLYVDAFEIFDADIAAPEEFLERGDRYDSLRICVGDKLVQKLADLKLFMVGCGAIGCEMMKNYALLGISSGEEGKITITDDDLIEKSNLNRQFLFRSHHIQKSKSLTAATSVGEINPSLHIKAHQKRVGSGTEDSCFDDEFFQKQDIVVNALDNAEARRYMDSRCVKNRKPLMESGTDGTHGHVLAIIPDLTQTYSAHKDSVATSIPFCTLKSFPTTIEHTVQWARDKFANLFTIKPTVFRDYWQSTGSPHKLSEKMQSGDLPKNSVQSLKLLKNRPIGWKECVSIARVKFEKYFNHKARQLLHTYPANAKTEGGGIFWKHPKKTPTPVYFDASDELHMSFIISTAILYAHVCNVSVTNDERSSGNVVSILEQVTVPEFVPSSKKVVIDETVTKDDAMSDTHMTGNYDDDLQMCIKTLQQLQKSGRTQDTFLQITPAEFEKDDDTNGHIDFIASSSNLRASMYGIELADRYKTKRIAGKIVPAIATTTSTVSGLVTLELIRYVSGANKRENYRNCFLNLAVSMINMFEPASPIVSQLKPGVSYTEWDMWHVHGKPDFTMQDFVNFFKEKYELTVTMVVQGSDMLYVSSIARFNTLSDTMMSLIKTTTRTKYVDLEVAFDREDPENTEDLSGPPIRYHF